MSQQQTYLSVNNCMRPHQITGKNTTGYSFYAKIHHIYSISPLRRLWCILCCLLAFGCFSLKSLSRWQLADRDQCDFFLGLTAYCGLHSQYQVVSRLCFDLIYTIMRHFVSYTMLAPYQSPLAKNNPVLILCDIQLPRCW